jgi:serpin B
MKTTSFFLAITMMMLAVSCQKDPAGPRQPLPIDLPDKADEVIAGSNAFGVNLFRATALAEDENMMLSPLSASTALTLLLNGCNGETYSQVRNMMGYEGLTVEEVNSAYQSLVKQLLAVDPDVQLSLANAVWYREGFSVKLPYLETMDSAFDAEIAALDFFSPTALQTINGWAKEKTNGKIGKVLNEISPEAVMFLMNALYFKGTWTYQFSKSSTYEGPFTLDSGELAIVEMMKNKIPVKIHFTEGANALELPYGRQNFSMVVIVPSATLGEYLESFGPDAWAEITDGLDYQAEPLETEIIMPKFKFDYEKVLNDQLGALGMTDAFDPNLADLSGISDEDIFVSFVKQNTFVEVNEEGTEAAAVTTIGIDITSLPGSFYVDKPFIFAIRERTTNTLLFIGKVERPEV